MVDDLREDSAWKVSINSPQAGDYSAVWWEWEILGLPPGDIMAFSPFINAPHSARVNAGDTIAWSAYLKVDSLTGTPQEFPYIQFYTSGGSSIRLDKGTVSNLTGSYVQYSMNIVAPTNAHYMRAAFGFAGGSGNGSSLYFDTAVLGVTP